MAALLDLLHACDVDDETISFLLQALSNAEDLQEKLDVLEPFVPDRAEEARALLTEDPGAVPVCIEVYQKRQEVKFAKLHPNAHSPLLAWAHDGLPFCDTYAVTRISMLCREIRPFTFVPDLWEPRLRRVAAFWSLPIPEDDNWRENYFSILRPRWDGVYVGNCGYKCKVRPGSSMTDKRTAFWVHYRRYLRLCPPDEDGKLRALVLQDAAPLDIAMEVITGLDASTHIALNSQSSLANGCTPSQHKGLQTKEVRSQLAGKTFSASYEFREGQIFLTYLSDMGKFDAVLKVSHSQTHYFSEQLEWVDYTLTKEADDPIKFNLGRNIYGNPADPTSNHFAHFILYSQRAFEHYL